MIHTHPHPGAILKETLFEPSALSVTDTAERLAMSRVALSRVINGKGNLGGTLGGLHA